MHGVFKVLLITEGFSFDWLADWLFLQPFSFSFLFTDPHIQPVIFPRPLVVPRLRSKRPHHGLGAALLQLASFLSWPQTEAFSHKLPPQVFPRVTRRF